MNRADVSIVITTHDRPELLARAVDSALSQTYPSLEVVVVDDGSIEPVGTFGDTRVRVVRHSRPRGSALARNAGLEAARGRWVTFLDDDDELLPLMIEVSLEGFRSAALPPPVAVLSGLEVVDGTGRVLQEKLPPTCPRGTVFALEEVPGFPPGRAYETKQTLLIEREILRRVGGWEDGFQPRETTELFLRLSKHCSFVGLPVITYRHLNHGGPRLTSDAQLQEQSFERLVRKHHGAFEAHPRGYAHFLRMHAHHLRRAGRWGKSLKRIVHAFRLDPLRTLAETPGWAASDLRGAMARRRRGTSKRDHHAS